MLITTISIKAKCDRRTMRRERCCFFFFFSEDGISLLKHVLLIENCCVISSNNQFSALASVCFFLFMFLFLFFFVFWLIWRLVNFVLWHMHQSNLIQLRSAQMAIWFHISSTSGPCVTDRRVNVLATLSKRHKNASSFFFFFLELFSISFRSKTSCQNHQRIHLNPYDNNLSKCIRYY